MANNNFNASIRLLMAISYVGVWYYNEKYVFFEGLDESETSIFTGKYVFLTNLNLVFLTGCLAYSAMCSCLAPEGAVILHKLDGLLCGASSAMSLFVFALFWTLYTVDRELVYPAELDSIIPPWHNHALHTTIVPVSLINFCLVPSRRAPRLLAVQAASVSLGVAYIAWVHVVHSVTGFWAYPILRILTAAQRLGFIVGCCLAVVPFAWTVHLVKTRVDAGRRLWAKKSC